MALSVISFRLLRKQCTLRSAVNRLEPSFSIITGDSGKDRHSVLCNNTSLLSVRYYTSSTRLTVHRLLSSKDCSTILERFYSKGKEKGEKSKLISCINQSRLGIIDIYFIIMLSRKERPCNY